MSKYFISLATAALVLGSAAFGAQAQTLTPGAAGLNAQAQSATITHKTACGGPGRHCSPGRHWVCGPNHCWCAPC